ncbi:MAG: hypothetical protein DRI37_10335 [Chloroflexi bacterium]|nr:MAG: hypothetical protein DRI37_10335 [Chloroflexota bacterium]
MFVEAQGVETPSAVKPLKGLRRIALTPKKAISIIPHMFVLRFPVFEIREGKNRSLVTVSPAELEVEYSGAVFEEPVQVEVVFTRYGSGINVRVFIKTIVKLVCSRCLKPFDYALESSFEAQVQLQRGGPAFADFWEEDFSLLDAGSGLIDLRERVREEIILDMPWMPLCSPDCEGGGYYDSGEDRIDPRWKGLEAFGNDKSKDEKG